MDDTADETAAAALAGLLAAGAAHAMVTMTVWVTVEARAVIVVVGAAPLAKTVVVRKERTALNAFIYQHLSSTT